MAIGSVGAIIGSGALSNPHYPSFSSRDSQDLDRQLTVEKIRRELDLKDLFTENDRDKSGKLDLNELRQMFSKTADVETPEEVLRFLIRVADVDGDQQVDRKEFRYAVQGWELYNEHLEKRNRKYLMSDYEFFDKDKNGKIDLLELHDYLRNLNLSGDRCIEGGVSTEISQWVMKVSDMSGSGMLSSAEEFAMATAAWVVHVARESKKSKACVSQACALL